MPCQTRFSERGEVFKGKFDDKFVSSNLISKGFATPDHGNTFFETREQLPHSENILEIDKFKMFRRWASFHFPGVSIPK